jgi:hypothetical protein
MQAENSTARRIRPADQEAQKAAKELTATDKIHPLGKSGRDWSAGRERRGDQHPDFTTEE